MYRIQPGGGISEKWVTLTKKVRYFDFDENKNIYAAGTLSDIFIIDKDKNFKTSNLYQAYDIFAVRVYGGYIYILADYKGTDSSIPDKGVWKSKILNSAGDLGTPELVLDWALTGKYSGSTFYDIAFSSTEYGNMYIGTDYREPVLVVHSDGTMESLYPELLNPNASQLVWGNNVYLYINRSGTPDVRNLVRVDMAKTSAPYYGRN